MKKTALLTEVTSILKEQNCPLSVPQIQELLKKRSFLPNKTTLYRMLEKLKQHGDIESILLDNAVAHFEYKTHHHHHFICNDCKDITCIADETLENHIHRVQDILAAKGLSITSHQFSFSGMCHNCQ
jgi:Fe2+ or Zn2+ uptake regulation protein